jgi:iron complex outermembrane receptor protein
MLWSSKFATTQVPNSYTLRNGVLTNAVYPATSGGIPFTVYDQISRVSESDSGYLALDADWQASDRLSFKFEGGTTKGHGKTPSQDALEVALDADAGASWSSAAPPRRWTGTSAAMAHWTAGPFSSTAVFGLQDSDAKDKEDWFSADGELISTAACSTRLRRPLCRAHRQNNGGNNELATGALSGYTFPASNLHYPGDWQRHRRQLSDRHLVLLGKPAGRDQPRPVHAFHLVADRLSGARAERGSLRAGQLRR